jgi:Family of unknown function (DUF6368)
MGPIATVYVNANSAKSFLEYVHKEIFRVDSGDSLATEFDGYIRSTVGICGSYDGPARPFGVILKTLEADEECPISLAQREALAKCLHVQIGYTAMFYASCNTDADHSILMDVCFACAELFDGVVSFNGDLALPRECRIADEVPADGWACFSVALNDARLVRLLITPFGGATRPVDFGNAAFVNWWRRLKGARMIV